MPFTISGSLAVDETSGTQQGSSGSNAFADNDVSIATFSSTAGAPEFDLLLASLFLPAPTGASVSNASSTNPTGTALLTGLGADVTDLAFTDVNGDPLDGDVAKFGGGPTDFLLTADGFKIYLYSYTGPDIAGIDENNVVLGRKAFADGTANPNGTVVFAAYLQPTDASGNVQSSDVNAVGAKVWLVEYEPLDHGTDGSTAAAYDDTRILFDPLFVTVSNRVDFSLEGAPSGQNLFLMYGDGTPAAGEAAIVVTGKNPINQSIDPSGITSGDTVNTGQGGGGTTIGSNNQMIDPAEGMYFSFVTLSADSVGVTVPNLDQNEADVEANIKFASYLGVNEAIFTVVQMQPPKAATLKLSAFNVTDATETGTGYIDGLNDGDDAAVNITSVTITRTVKTGGTTTTTTYNFAADTGVVSNGGLTLDFTGNTVKITGVIAGDVIDYKTATEHNRVLIDNIGNTDAKLNAAFDIGGFSLINSSVTTGAFQALTFQDDGPSATGAAVTATVDEDGLSGGIAGGVGDVAGEAFSASGSVAGIFDPGADGLGSYGLSTDTSGLPALNSKGAAVVYDVTGNLLTAYVEEGGGAGYQAIDDREVFTLSLNGTNGAYIFTLLDQLDHPTLNGLAGDDTENDLVLNLGSILQATDKDGDKVTAAAEKLAITVDDDTPVVTTKSNLFYSNANNPAPGGTGLFDYLIGADERSSYSAANSDLIVALTGGTVGANTISSPSVTWVSENDSQAVFNVAFTYVSNPISNTTTNATGTLTFDKVGGTYTLSLTQPIQSFNVLSTATAQGFTGYLPGPVPGVGETTDNTQPEVTVAQLASNFFVQFTGNQEPAGGTGANNLKATGVDADNNFVAGELFTQAATWVSVSGTAAGVAGDTMQQGEVLDFDFFSTNPKGNTSADPSATSSAIFIQFDGLDNNEDLVVILKLVDASDPSITTTKAVIADFGDIFHKADAGSIPPAFGFTGTLDNNDGLVVIESQDYNGAGENWLIEGAQVLASTEGVTGTGINLNGAIGTGGASTTTQTFGDSEDVHNTLTGTEAGTWDGDVFKIVNIGFVTAVTPDALLTFDVSVVDADGDATSTQTLNVNIVGNNSLTATAGSDSFAFSDPDADGLLSIVMYNITGGFVSGTDKLNFAAAGSGTNYEEKLAAETSVAAFVGAADTELDGTVDYYFGVVGGNGYLAFDEDGNGITSIVQLVGVTDMAFGDII